MNKKNLCPTTMKDCEHNPLLCNTTCYLTQPKYPLVTTTLVEVSPTTPAPADILYATADEIKEGLQNSFYKETGEYYFNNLKVWSNWLENKIVEHRQYVDVPTGSVEELERLAEQEFRNYKMKNDSYWYCFKDGFISGYQHKPAKGEGKEEIEICVRCEVEECKKNSMFCQSCLFDMED